MSRYWSQCILFGLRPRWVVNEGGELGLRILGVNLYYYKRATPLVYEAPAPTWRYVRHREFGETVLSPPGAPR